MRLTVLSVGVEFFPGPGGGLGVSFNGRVLAWVGTTALSRMYGALKAPFASLHGYLVPFLKATNVTSILCMLSEWLLCNEKLKEDIIYFNNKISKLNLIEISRLFHQQLQNILFAFQRPKEHFHKLFHTWPWNKFQTIFIIKIWLWWIQKQRKKFYIFETEEPQLSKNFYHRDHIMIMLEFSNKEKKSICLKLKIHSLK